MQTFFLDHVIAFFLPFFFLQILFATFDPPNPPGPGNVGHFCVVALNLKQKCFQLLDSLRGDNDPDAQRVFFTMASGIKKLWREARNKKGGSF